jgi:hypothetical protein
MHRARAGVDVNDPRIQAALAGKSDAKDGADGKPKAEGDGK